MKHLVRLRLWALVGIILVASCKKSVPPQLKFISKNASLVASVNADQLKDKLVKSQASLEKIISNMSGNNDTALEAGKKEWAALKKSGIDLEKNMYVWVVQKGGAGSTGSSMGNTITAAIASIKSSDQLATYIKSKEATLEVKKDKNFSYVTRDGDKMIAWNDQSVVAMFYNRAYTGGMEYDSITGAYNMKAPADANLTKELMAEMTASFTRTEGESIASLKSFTDLAAEKADLSFWANPASSIEVIPFPLPKLKELAEGNYTAVTVNFEEGKMVVNSKSYSGKALSNIFKKYKGPEVNLDLVKRYPAADINGFMVFAFDPQIFSGIVKYMEVGAVADGYITKFMGTDYTLEQALKAFKGDIAVVVSGIGLSKRDSLNGSGPFSMPVAKMIFTVPVGDTMQMHKIMDRLAFMEMLEKTNGTYRLKGNPSGFGLTGLADNESITIASDDQLLLAYKLKSAAPSKNIDLKPFNGKSAAAYFDIASVLNGLNQPQQTDSTFNKMLNNAKATFKDVQAHSNNFDGDAIAGHFELRFVNEKENSLVSFLSFLAQASEVAKRDKKITVSDVLLEN
ncbi:MAG: DUF4836 family protein [Chitinophagaceae bacterium]|nr:DUF4836 family protein [Chitinophagaceae bacterium]